MIWPRGPAWFTSASKGQACEPIRGWAGHRSTPLEASRLDLLFGHQVRGCYARFGCRPADHGKRKESFKGPP